MRFKKIIAVLLVLVVVVVASIAVLQAQRAQANELKGTIESVSDRGVVMNGKTVAITGDTSIEGTLVPGTAVTITAKVQPDGSLLAVKISARDGQKGGRDEAKGKGGKGNGNNNGGEGERGNRSFSQSRQSHSENNDGKEVNGRNQSEDEDENEDENEGENENENENENEHQGRGGNSGSANLLAPTNLVAVNNGGQVVLTWTDNTTNETGFRIERATDTGFSANLTVFNVPANTTSFTDASVVIGTTYYYRLFALLTSPASNSASVSVVAVNTSLPAPTNLVAAFASGQVNLTWTDNSANETGFRVERATNPTFTAGLFTAAALVNATSYADNTVAQGVTYYYRVLAVNAGGDSVASNTASVSIPSTINAAALFTSYCASCHSVSGVSGRTTARITRVVSGGTGGMQAYSAVLTSAQISALAQYLGGTP